MPDTAKEDILRHRCYILLSALANVLDVVTQAGRHPQSPEWNAGYQAACEDVLESIRHG